MSLNRQQARDQLLGLVLPVLQPQLGDAQLVWDGGSAEPPRDSSVSWARISMIHAAGSQATLGQLNGQSRWRANGYLYVQLFTPFGDGLARDDQLSMLLLDALRGAKTAEGLWLRNANAREMGVDGGWHQTTVSSEFEYDEVV